MAEFCVLVYFPMWFTIKYKHSFTDGPQNYYLMVKLVTQFPDKHVRDIAMKNVLRNSYWAHPENVLVGMLAHGDYEVCNRAVNRILMIRGEMEEENVTDDDFQGGDLSSEEESIDRETDSIHPITCRKRDNSVRKFCPPVINAKSKFFL